VILFRYAAYLIVFLTFAVQVISAVVLRYQTSYAAPTAAYATQLVSGHGVSSPLGYWTYETEIEFAYPVPSMLLSVFVLLTNIPWEYTMFTPIAALAYLSYFVLARRIFRWAPNNYGLLLSAVFYAYVVFLGFRTGVGEVSRASFGDILFNFFLLVYVLYLSTPERSHGTGWPFVLLALTLATGESYYTSTLAILLFCLFMTTVFPVIQRFVKQPSHFPALPTTILAILLLVYNTYIASTMAAAKWSSFRENIVIRVLTVLGLAQPDVLSGSKMLAVDLVTEAAGTWVVNFTTYVSMVAIVCVLYFYRPQRQRKIARIWLFSLAVFVANLSAVPYLFFVPITPVGLLSRYSLIILFLVLAQPNGQANHQGGAHTRASAGRGALGKPPRVCRTIVLAIMLIMVLVGSLGAMRFGWYYGLGKPYAYQRIEPLSQLLLSHSSSRDPIALMGDAYYTANIFFIASHEGGLGNVVPDPLGRDAVVLYDSLRLNETSNLVESMRERNIRCQLLTPGSVWGDEWGYAVMLTSTRSVDDTTYLSLLYDGPSQLFCHIGP
jgi:hypothetical protein